ncbi:MAG: hypothetical protein ACRDM1_01725 [Gaiellaceae bacterium]
MAAIRTAVEPTPEACVTAPESPGLPIRIETAMLHERQIVTPLVESALVESGDGSGSPHPSGSESGAQFQIVVDPGI